MLTSLFRWLGGTPAFRIYGKAKPEIDWRVIDVFANPRRSCTSGWPILRGHCICWTPRVIAVGCDVAEGILREQSESPASRERPVEVPGGRLRFGRDPRAPCVAPFSELLAHEIGHTFQAIKLGPLYLPTGALFTWWREGPHWWNKFENKASERGQFGGIVSGSVEDALWKRISS